jgi:hypothetical protein
MANYTLAGIDLGQIQTDSSDQWSELQTNSYPLGDSRINTVDDYEGVKRIITLTGQITADTEDALWNIIAQLDALQNGMQSTVQLYHPKWDLTTTGNYQDGIFNVKVQRFKVDYVNTALLLVKYTLTLYEGQQGM